ncbi:hypothetical protein K7X08_022646 [Anisodus acutangulus]|uniref:Uncharacterized protein n=1 Tax=Anisodus acutangulus TaxID=402998 RepID=A0A9Q1MIF1_9SOLA|nr:hypothetical protein K7X08_022646 [Anisodus acutangulus]
MQMLNENKVDSKNEDKDQVMIEKSENNKQIVVDHSSTKDYVTSSFHTNTLSHNSWAEKVEEEDKTEVEDGEVNNSAQVIGVEEINRQQGSQIHMQQNINGDIGVDSSIMENNNIHADGDKERMTVVKGQQDSQNQQEVGGDNRGGNVTVEDKSISTDEQLSEHKVDVAGNMNIGSYPSQLFPGRSGGTLVIIEEGELLAVIFPKTSSPNKVLHDLIEHSIKINEEETTDKSGECIMENKEKDDKEDNVLQNIENMYLQVDISPKFTAKGQKKGALCESLEVTDSDINPKQMFVPTFSSRLFSLASDSRLTS